MTQPTPLLIDGVQFCLWSEKIFSQMRQAGMSAVHVTVSYHENFRKTVEHIIDWYWRFQDYNSMILLARGSDDIDHARATGRTAIFLGLQTPMPLEDDLGLVEVLYNLGVRFLQPTYNNQSLLGSGWMEAHDSGLTRMGREVIRQMNRLGMIIDMSHAGEKTALDAIAVSSRPVAISHANPNWWHHSRRNISRDLIKALGDSAGMLGLSLYPHHLAQGAQTRMESFCSMVAEVADIIGTKNLGIGSDLCQDQPDTVIRWMREGRWARPRPEAVVNPPQPDWFQTNLDFPKLAQGLRGAGFAQEEVENILGRNWYQFLKKSLQEQKSSP